MERLDLENGKYTIINNLHNGGALKALRYGEEWKDLPGDHLTLALMAVIEDLISLNLWQARRIKPKQYKDYVYNEIERMTGQNHERL